MQHKTSPANALPNQSRSPKATPQRMTTQAKTATTAPKVPLRSRLLAKAVQKALNGIQHGHLTVRWPDGHTTQHGSAAHGLQATWHIHSNRTLHAVLQSGDIGLGEAYMDGHWSTPNLTNLLNVFTSNRNALEHYFHGRFFGTVVHRIRHLLNRNTKQQSKKNIEQHYDLGNDFYRLWLDPSMNYSSAWFGTLETEHNLPLTTAEMVQAQRAKVQRALSEVDAAPNSRILEIGCGWGALAEEAVAHFDAHITGVTLSTEQLQYAKQRLRNWNAHTQSDLRLQDYRDIDDAPFDGICSIEMLEAVGQDYWNTYFSKIASLLKPTGKACVQVIVIKDSLLANYLQSTDFIRRHIFPGGCLISPSEVENQASQAGLSVHRKVFFGRDYARTLAYWHEQFDAQETAIRALGFDDRFLRMWRFYLSLCEAAFWAGDIDVAQYTLQHTQHDATASTNAAV